MTKVIVTKETIVDVVDVAPGTKVSATIINGRLDVFRLKSTGAQVEANEVIILRGEDTMRFVQLMFDAFAEVLLECLSIEREHVDE